MLQNGDSSHLVVWPRGTSQDGNSIVLRNGTAINEGNRVSGAGGFHPLSSLGDLLATPSTVAAGCAASPSEVAVFGQLVDVEVG